jgi:hypothetical protein
MRMNCSLNCLVDNAATIDDVGDDFASHSIELLFNHTDKLFGSERT